MKTLFALAIAMALLAGCASPNKAHIEAQAKAAEAKALADRAYYESLKVMADGAGDGPRTAAIMSAFMRQQSLAQSQPVMQREANWADYGFRFLDVALRAYGIERGAAVALRQSDNARDVSVASYGALADTAALIQAPQANVTQTLSGTGVLGDGAYTAPVTTTSTTTTTNQDDHTVAGSYNPVETTTYPQSP